MSTPTHMYECSLSGVRAEGEYHFENDKLGDLPVGWVQITIKRRSFNPRWVAIQNAKESSVALIMAQLPKQLSAEVRANQEQMLRLQQEAHYHGLEKETPVYLTSEEVVYVADPLSSSDVKAAFDEARAGLNLGPMELEGEPEDGQDAQTDEEREEEEEYEENENDDEEGESNEDDDEDDE
jgi:hypothetical protein